MEIKTLRELINGGIVNYNDIILRIPLPHSLADVVAIIFPNFLDLTQFMREVIAPKIDPKSIWSDVVGLGKSKGVLLLFRKNTLEKHIRPLPS